MSEIDLTSFEKFANELASKYPDYALDSAVSALEDMSDYLLEQVPEYPAETLERLMPPDGVSFLKTHKQRAWFFASVKEGTLPGWQWIDGHPKKIGGARTGNLGRAQGSEVSREDDVVIAVLGFDPALAP